MVFLLLIFSLSGCSRGNAVSNDAKINEEWYKSNSLYIGDKARLFKMDWQTADGKLHILLGSNTRWLPAISVISNEIDKSKGTITYIGNNTDNKDQVLVIYNCVNDTVEIKYKGPKSNEAGFFSGVYNKKQPLVSSNKNTSNGFEAKTESGIPRYPINFKYLGDSIQKVQSQRMNSQWIVDEHFLAPDNPNNNGYQLMGDDDLYMEETPSGTMWFWFVRNGVVQAYYDLDTTHKSSLITVREWASKAGLQKAKPVVVPYHNQNPEILVIYYVNNGALCLLCMDQDNDFLNCHVTEYIIIHDESRITDFRNVPIKKLLKNNT